MKVAKFTDYEIDGIDYADYPKFCDAFICGATAVLEDGSMREATDEELNMLNDDDDLVHDEVESYLY